MAKRKSDRTSEARQESRVNTSVHSRVDRATLHSREALSTVNVFSIVKKPMPQIRARTFVQPVEPLSRHNDNHSQHMAMQRQAFVEAKTENITTRSNLKIEHDNSPQKVRENTCKKRPEKNKKVGSGGKARRFIPWC